MLFKKSTLGLVTIATLTCSGLSLATQVPVFAQSSEYYQENSEYYQENSEYYQDQSDTYSDYAADEQYNEDYYSDDSDY